MLSRKRKRNRKRKRILTKQRSEKTMKKRINEKPFYYNHVINEFIVDTLHLDVLEKYAYLTLIWEAHRQRGTLTNESLEKLYKVNKDIPTETYRSVLFEFFDVDESENYSNKRVTSDLQNTNQHKEISSKGGKTSSLHKMINSDQRIDEYNQIHDAYPSKRRVARKEGLALYCKQLRDDKRMTFKRVMQVVKGFDCQPQFYPQLDTLLRDTQGKYWKVEKELTSSEKDILLEKVERKLRKKGFSWVGHEERNAIPEFKEIYNLTKEEF
jgi:uncharacterized protein YdaU (DUF1376 family)